METLKQNELAKAASIIKNGGIVAFPTETVFGLGVIYNNKEAYDKLIAVKKRPPSKPFTLMCGSVNDIVKYAEINEVANRLISNFMPGQFTIILKAKKGLPSWVISSQGNVGIRVSSDPLVASLIKEVGSPLLVPSANISSEPPLTKDKDVFDTFNDKIDALIEGESTSNVPSSIVSIDEKVDIIRLGLISEQTILNVIKSKPTKIAIASDHAGYEYKEEVKKYLIQKGYEIFDAGTNSKQSCDYPIFAHLAAKEVAKEEAKFGVLVCSSGEGIAISANKIKGVRCGLGYNDEVSSLLRQHNNANMIAFGQSFMKLDDVLRRVDIFLNSYFEGGRHKRRVDEIEC